MPNGNARGSTADRRARKLFLLKHFGDGDSCLCHECGKTLTYATVFVDRIIPAIHGGRYTRDNIAPHCGPCSHKQGSRIRRLYSAEVLLGRHYRSAPYRKAGQRIS